MAVRFELGRTYSAAEITAVVGGQEAQSFPVEGRRTVAVRVGRGTSPDAPARVYVGNRPREIRAARNLVSVGEPVPVFVREDPTSDFAFVGRHRAQGFDESPGAAQGATNAVGRPMAGILHLEPVG
ncbi:MAG: hypothetical protein KY461_05875 [Actinobacteria bacterium]|nr:hypothetical protein [Actinomycetota bacterium]